MLDDARVRLIGAGEPGYEDTGVKLVSSVSSLYSVSSPNTFPLRRELSAVGNDAVGGRIVSGCEMSRRVGLIVECKNLRDMKKYTSLRRRRRKVSKRIAEEVEEELMAGAGTGWGSEDSMLDAVVVMWA